MERSGTYAPPSNGYAKTAKDAAGRADLHIPKGALDVKLKQAPIDHSMESYLITFYIPRKQLYGSHIDLGDKKDPSAMQEYVKNAFNMFPHTSKSIGYSGISSKNPSWWRHAIVNPGDPAHVGILVEHVGR